MRTLELYNRFHGFGLTQLTLILMFYLLKLSLFLLITVPAAVADNSVWPVRCSWEERLSGKPDLDGFDLANGRGCIEGNRQRTY